MSRTPKYKSDAFEAIHSSAEGMFRAGTIDKAILRRFDKACLSVPSSPQPVENEASREANPITQSIAARYLNTSESAMVKAAKQR